MRDPFAISPTSFVAAQENRVVHLDADSKVTVLYTLEGPGLVHEPRPLLPRPRERVIPPRTRNDRATGTMILANVYQGRNLPGVQRGDIEAPHPGVLPKPVNFSGGPDLVSWLGTFTLERVWGSAVERTARHSAFPAPAVLPWLEADLSVKRMRVSRA
jgi:hypothetical protein